LGALRRRFLTATFFILLRAPFALSRRRAFLLFSSRPFFRSSFLRALFPFLLRRALKQASCVNFSLFNGSHDKKKKNRRSDFTEPIP
jgi:hypothetical protein